MARWIVLVFLSLMLLTAARGDVRPAEAPARIALIIANSDYDPRGVQALQGPKRDAELMEAAFKNIGFETLVVRDADRAQMAQSFSEFSDRLEQTPQGSTGIVYYSGHGKSFGIGQDYLVGVDLYGHSELDVEAESFHYQALFAALEATGEGRNIVLAMDTNRVPSASSSRAFTIADPPPNVFEIWASRYGDYAVDTAEGTEGASPFSHSLAQALETPGLDVRVVFAKVQSGVLELTDGEQYPEVFIPHTEPLVLNVVSGRSAQAGSAPETDAPILAKSVAPLVQSSTSAGNVGAALELALWQSAVELNTADAIDDFLEKFPDSLLADQALLRREALRKRAASAPPVTSFETLNPLNAVAGPPRIALLIGNKAYAPNLSELTNPHNDIDLVGERLREVGFEVMLARDADPDEMVKALAAFTQKLSDATSEKVRPVAFFYYSGHGFAPQEQGRNYLVPVGMQVTSITELLRAMSIESVVERVEAMKPHVSFFVFDACRNDPGLPGEEGTKSAAGSKGFNVVNVSGGSLITYATAEGEVAFDAPQEDVGPYARALAEGLQLEGADAYRVFKHAQRTVYKTSEQKQLPWISDRLIEDFVFRE